jgi:hypothetical protein
MVKMLSLLILLWLIAGNLFAASSVEKKTGKNPYFTPGFDVSREHFFDFLRKEAPKDFCSSDSYFVKCFTVKESSCPREVQHQIDLCHNSVRVPEKFDVLDIDANAEQIGSCVGVNLEKKWHDYKLEAKECRERL